MIAQDALRDGAERLRHAGVPDPARDARVLLADAMGIATGQVTLFLRDEISANSLDRFQSAIARRTNREPVSHILGRREFMGRSFKVTADVLDPRPETETLVIEVLKEPFSRVLDLGTGSGCILLSLLAERPGATGLGVDISEAALAVAKANADAHQLENRVQFVNSNWFEAVVGRFDLIVSNPPYIDAAEWQTLEPEPRKWEPKQALTPGADGLAPYRVIAENADRFLAPAGWIMVEIGWQQGKSVTEIFRQAGFQDISVMPDLDGRDRVVRAKSRA